MSTAVSAALCDYSPCSQKLPLPYPHLVPTMTVCKRLTAIFSGLATLASTFMVVAGPEDVRKR